MSVHWGETPCAFVMLKDGAKATADDIIEFCRARLPRYMAPRTVVFGDLPKTSTGKTQKYLLREKAMAMGSLHKQGRSRLWYQNNVRYFILIAAFCYTGFHYR